MDTFDFNGYKVCIYTDNGTDYYWDACHYATYRDKISNIPYSNYSLAQLAAKSELSS